MRLLWRVRLSRALKIRLMSVFGTTSITTAVSLYHAYAVLRVGGTTEANAATIQVIPLLDRPTIVLTGVITTGFHQSFGRKFDCRRRIPLQVEERFSFRGGGQHSTRLCEAEEESECYYFRLRLHCRRRH